MGSIKRIFQWDMPLNTGNVSRFFSFPLRTAFFLGCLCLAFSLSISCVREDSLHEDEIEIAFDSGDEIGKIAPSAQIYVSVQGDSAERVQRFLVNGLRDSGFTICENPGKADHIVQVAVVFSGKTDEESIHNALREGYDTKVSFQGKSVGALVVDLLIVRREVPKEKTDRKSSLATISNRHALGSIKKRLALYVPNLHSMRPLPTAFAYALAREVSQTFVNGRKNKAGK